MLCAIAAVWMAAVPIASAETIREMQQWYLDAVQALQAQAITKGAGVVVAVVDTGIDAGHPDLAGAILPGKSFTGSDDSLQNDSYNGHGTKMSAVIAARGGGYNNALGIAPAASILPVAISFGSNAASIAEPIRWAADHSAKIINLSVDRRAGQPLEPGEADAIAYAQSKDVVVVVAAGNIAESPNGNQLARLPGVVAVSGTTQGDTLWSGSAQGDYVDIAAPGKGIVNAGARMVHSTGYATGDGTSESAAIVSGVLALIRAKHPDFDAANAINQLIQTADDKGAPGRDNLYGYGRVNAYRAVTETVAKVTANPLGEAKSAAKSSTTTTSTPASAKHSGSAAAILVPILFWLAVIALIWWRIRARKKKKLGAQTTNSSDYRTPPPTITPGSPPSQQ